MNVFAMWPNTGPTTRSSRCVVNSQASSNSTLHATGASVTKRHSPCRWRNGPSFSVTTIDSGGAVRVVGGEVRPDAVVVDVDPRRLAAGMRLEHARAGAPRQELRVELDRVDELEHRSGAEGHEHRLPYAGHGWLGKMTTCPDRCRGVRRGSRVRPRRLRRMSIVDNRKAYHDYFVEEKFEAGLALEGWEVKAIRAGRAQLKEAYVIVKGGEIVLIGAHITPLATASTHVQADPTRTRKLLLHKSEIHRLVGQVERAGYTLVPLNLHYSRGASSSTSASPRARSSTTSAQRSRSANGTASSSG